MVATGIALPAVRARSPSSRSSPSSARSIRRPATSACWCRWSTPRWRRASRDQERTQTFARYSLIGALATAAGALAAAAPRSSGRAAAWTQLAALKLMFYAYAALGAARARALPLPAAAPQIERPRPPARRSGRRAASCYKLAALFSLDAFAGGFVVQSLLALWLFERFDLSLHGRERVLLLVERARGVLLSGRGVAREAASGWSTRWCSPTSRRASA